MMDNLTPKITDDLLALGVRPGGALLVHTSLKSLGPIPGGVETVIHGLLAALGEGGTLLMPALSYDTVRSYHPVFDLRTTPSCVGALPEYFRTRTGTRRSLHPTHSVCALGPLTDKLLFPHKLDSTPCGSHSPFHRLPEFEGQILMLGCGLRPNTSMHAIEELVEPPYLFSSPLVYTLIDENGASFQKEYQRHNFQGWEQRYDRVAEILAFPDLRFGNVLSAQAHLIEAQALRKAALQALTKNPLYFVDPLTIP
ncbi:MAG: AAC(3) family N-acetyltransferase [Anaerolineales bacterium]